MSDDLFSSGTLSLILAWICCLPLLVAILVLPTQHLGETFSDDSPVGLKLFAAWIFLCVVGLSPMRYLFFQLALSAAYPWQSMPDGGHTGHIGQR